MDLMRSITDEIAGFKSIHWELRHRRKSKKARKRLVRSILRRRPNGPFERLLHFRHFCELAAKPISQPIWSKLAEKNIVSVKEFKDSRDA
jgi:hypothetical protein